MYVNCIGLGIHWICPRTKFWLILLQSNVYFTQVPLSLSFIESSLSPPEIEKPSQNNVRCDERGGGGQRKVEAQDVGTMCRD